MQWIIKLRPPNNGHRKELKNTFQTPQRVVSGTCWLLWRCIGGKWVLNYFFLLFSKSLNLNCELALFSGGASRKGRSKKEASDNTNRPNPGGHERKLVEKLQNTEKKAKAWVNGGKPPPTQSLDTLHIFKHSLFHLGLRCGTKYKVWESEYSTFDLQWILFFVCLLAY